MFSLDGRWIYSATDLVTALRCEYGLLRRRAELAGVVEAVQGPEDALLEQAAELGLLHEERHLHRLIELHGEGTIGTAGGVVSIERPSTMSRVSLEQAHRDTIAALAGGANVVYQAAFFDGSFHGLADFVCRLDRADGMAVYEPADAKLSRHARVEALLQLTAYAQQLVAAGLPKPEAVHLWLGDGSISTHRLADLLPILVDRARRMEDLLDRDAAVPDWSDRGLRRCGRCQHCVAAIDEHRDVFLVAGMRADQRRKLADAGTRTIEELVSGGSPARLSQETFLRLQAQAALQIAQDATRSADNPSGEMSFDLYRPEGLALIPSPNPGDVFFDFEGDPLYTELGWPDLGLEYLFGVMTHGQNSEEFDPIWAHERAAERAATEQFIDWLVERRSTPGFEGMHVYHYAQYEVTALKRLVQRHGTREAELDYLLRDEVFVDLYSVVRRSVRVSERSYSIKSLEPLYMGDDLRTGEVTGGAASIAWYAAYGSMLELGDLTGAAKKLGDLADYNRYDCLSTLRLRDWLLGLSAPATDSGQLSSSAEPDDQTPFQSEALDISVALLQLVEDTPRAERTTDQQAIAMLAAGVLYHRREELPFWWKHFGRVAAPAEDWELDGEMIVLDTASIVVVDDWAIPEGRRNHFRTLECAVDLPGSFKLRPSDGVYSIYDAPAPSSATQPNGTERSFLWDATLDDIESSPADASVKITESLSARKMAEEGWAPHAQLPVAVTVKCGPSTKEIAAAVLKLASSVARADGVCAPHPALDVLRRSRPRLIGDSHLPPALDGNYAAAIVEALRELDRSYLAVQGPPGSGNNGLRLTDLKLREMITDDHGGCVVGGTAWDFVNPNRVPGGSLHLLVVEEAGQFSLADTLAVSQSAPRILLLGDPQQLPQVSQARHPEPIELSALEWLNRDSQVLSPEFGYFLDHSYRMHPAVCAPVSQLSYGSRLDSAPIADDRTLTGVPPGVVTVLIDHEGNSSASPEEADAVVQIVDELLKQDPKRRWTDEHGSVELSQNHILVVTPYNAQLNLIRARLSTAGFERIAVGTVDKFQGEEAPVVIVSMASSSAADSSRGAEFALSRNRLNVAISRAQHTAYLVHSPQLTDFVPATLASLAEMGGFLGVSQSGRS